MSEILSAYSNWMPLALAMMVGLCTVALFWATFTIITGSDRIQARIARLAMAENDLGQKQDSHGWKARLYGFLASLAPSKTPTAEWKKNSLREKLAQAGFPRASALQVFLGLRLITTGFCLFMALIIPAVRQLDFLFLALVLVASAGVGHLLPSYVVEIKSRLRCRAICREMPNFMDLLVVSVEAGLSLNASLKRVADETRETSPIVSQEISIVVSEINAGMSRETALRNLARRCGVDEVVGLTVLLIQGERFGVSIAQSLRVHSSTLRTTTRQRLEEAAAKIPLKLLFPLIFMILPSMLIAIGGPGIVRIWESLFK